MTLKRDASSYKQPKRHKINDYKNCRNKLNKIIIRTKDKYYNNKFSKVKDNIKDTWLLINKIINNKIEDNKNIENIYKIQIVTSLVKQILSHGYAEILQFTWRPTVERNQGGAGFRGVAISAHEVFSKCPRSHQGCAGCRYFPTLQRYDQRCVPHLCKM